MTSHFSSIGFLVLKEADMGPIFDELIASGTTIEAPRGTYVAWKMPEGVEMWANTNGDGQLVGCTPYFAGAGRVQVMVNTMLCWDEEWPLEGGLIGRLGPVDTESSPPIVIAIADFDLARAAAAPGSVCDVQVAAFAHNLECFESEQAYYDAQTDEPRYSSTVFIPSGLFISEPGDRPRAHAAFAGKIQLAEVIINPWSGRNFHHLVVTSLPGVLDIVADPELLETPPVVGGIARGSFWLSGRLLDA